MSVIPHGQSSFAIYAAARSAWSRLRRDVVNNKICHGVFRCVLAVGLLSPKDRGITQRSRSCDVL